MNRTLPIAALVATLAARPAVASSCALQQVEIAPVTAENGDTYRGSAGDVEVLFHNDVTDHPVTRFPEPPLTVRHLRPAGECRVEDGGVWRRDGVWLVDDGRTLLTTESSGSSLDLVFRDTRSCAKVASLDVAGVSWRIEGHALLLRRADAKADRRVPLTAACRPAVATRPRR
jgi:hypothetical protein